MGSAATKHRTAMPFEEAPVRGHIIGFAERMISQAAVLGIIKPIRVIYSADFQPFRETFDRKKQE